MQKRATVKVKLKTKIIFSGKHVSICPQRHSDLLISCNFPFCDKRMGLLTFLDLFVHFSSPSSPSPLSYCIILSPIPLYLLSQPFHHSLFKSFLCYQTCPFPKIHSSSSWRRVKPAFTSTPLTEGPSSSSSSSWKKNQRIRDFIRREI